MGLTRLSILRPLFITMVVLAMVVVGLVSYVRLGVDLLPAIDFPVVSVVVPYPGAGPESIEQLVVKPIEDALAGERNLDYIISQSNEGIGAVILVYKIGADASEAAIDVERKVSGIRGLLPQDVRQPSVVRADINAMPVMNLSVSGRRSVDELYKLADEKIAPRLTTVSGVASAGISGGRQQEVVVDVDVDRLRAYGLSILQLNQLLQGENLSAPAGTITERGRDNSVRVNALYTTPEKIRDTVIASTSTGPVRVGDVARVSLGYQRIERIQRTNGREAVGILLTKQSGANTLQVADGVRRALDKLRLELPSDVQIEVVSDQSIFTRSSLDSVQLNLVEAVLLTGIVLLLFLHTWRSTFIVLIAIPTSLISTFTAMYVLGFTLNMMSLMALALTVGILVDDSIVVLENIFRHLEIGESRFNAALKGRSEIGMAAIAITLCDVVVYAPIAFMGEIVGQYFRQFGLVVATATLLSLFVSFTLTPMLASFWLRLPNPTSRSPLSRFGRVWESGFGRLERDYGRLLRLALRHRLWTVGLGLASLAAGIALIAAHAVGAEFMPRTDESQIIATLEMPAGTTLGVTNEAARRVEERLRGWPETKAVFSTVGVGGNDLLTSSRARSARITVELVKPSQRTRSQAQLADAARLLANDIPNAKLRVSQASFVGEGGPPLSILVSGDDDARLAEIVHQVEAIARAVPGTADVTNSMAEGSPETTVIVDRDRAAELGLTAGQIAQALRTGIAGTVITQYQPPGQKSIDIRVIARDADRASVDQLAGIPLMGTSGVMARLGQVAAIEQSTGPSQINRRDRQRYVAIQSELSGRALGDVVRDIEQQTAAIQLPPGLKISFTGDTEAQEQTFREILGALLLSVLLMYMLMVALYESLLSPFVVMLSLPLAVVGAIVGLWISGDTLNVMSMIGMIMLTGLVGKNAILLVDYTNTLRRRGEERDAALLHAGPTRLRPILMTTAAMITAMMPAALRLGEGAEMRAALAVVVIGGLLSSTLLTLVMIPAIYSIVDDLQHLIARTFGSFRLPRRHDTPGATPPLEPASVEERQLVTR